MFGSTLRDRLPFCSESLEGSQLVGQAALVDFGWLAFAPCKMEALCNVLGY
jgi:hypothetical protein